MKLRSASIMAVAMMVVGIMLVIPTIASAESGTCGNNLTWSLENNVLTIQGRGDMSDYSYQEVPWGDMLERITMVHIGDDVTSIGAYAFDGCENLTDITIGCGLVNIFEAALQGCYSLNNISVAENNSYYSSIDGDLYNKEGTEIIQYAIGKTNSSYVFPEQVTHIGAAAFLGCKNLKSITISENIKEIGELALDRCSGLLNITVSAENENYLSIDGNLYNRDATELMQYAIGNDRTFFIVPDSVKTINPNAFGGCTKLKNITIGDNVEEIGAYTFASCSGLLSVKIGESVKNIGAYAFGNCSNMTSIVIPVSVIEISNLAFSGCTCLADVYYTGSEESWRNIEILVGNDCLNEATKHYQYSVVNQTISHISVDDCIKTDTGYCINASIQTNVIGAMNATFYICVYSANGVLKSVLKHSDILSASEKTIVHTTILTDEGDVVRAFLWKNNLAPLSSYIDIVK